MTEEELQAWALRGANKVHHACCEKGCSDPLCDSDTAVVAVALVAAWQAGRKAGIEEAARYVEGIGCSCVPTFETGHADDCYLMFADGVRALLEEKSKP